MARNRLLCPRGLVVAAMVASAGLSSCGGGSGDGLDGNGRPVGEGGSSDRLVASHASIQIHVFTPRCTACHAGGAAPAGLRLDAGNSYAMLVGVPSAQVSALRRVAPGRPDDSYLIHKIEGHASVGARMPLGGPYLDADTVAVIRKWIADGALQ